MERRQLRRHVEHDLDRFGSGFRPHQDQGIVQHAEGVDRAHMRMAAAQEVAHAPHDAGGVIDLRDQVGKIAVGARMIDARRAQELLDGACKRTRRRHRLVDLVRERGGHAAHEGEAGGLCGLQLFRPQPRLDLPHGAGGLAALGHDHADRQAGGGQDQHERLELGEHIGVVAMVLQQSHEAELRQREPEAGAVETMAHRRHHDRQEEQIEILEACRALGSENEPQQQGHECNIENDLGRQRAQRTHGEVRRVQDQAERQRRHHRNPDQVADQQRQRSEREVAKIELGIGDQQQRYEHGHGRRTQAAADEQQQHIAQRPKAGIERQHASRDHGHAGVADRNDAGDADDDRPRQAAAQDRDFGDDHADEQHDAMARAGEQHEGKDGAEPWVPGRDRDALVFVDEAQPLEQEIGGKKGRSEQKARGACNECGARRAVGDDVSPGGSDVSDIRQQAAPARE